MKVANVFLVLILLTITLLWHEEFAENQSLRRENIRLSLEKRSGETRLRIAAGGMRNANDKDASNRAFGEAKSANVSISPTPINPYKDPKHPLLGERLYSRDVWRFYGPGIKKLGLSSNQQAALIHLLVVRQETIADSSDAASQSNLSESERNTLFQNEISSVNSQISDLIGNDGLKTIDNSTLIQTMRNQVDSTLAVDYEIANAPLSEEEKDRVASVMAACQGSSYPADVGDESADAKGDLSKQGAAIVLQAAAFLSGSQLQILRDYEVEQFELWKSAQGR